MTEELYQQAILAKAHQAIGSGRLREADATTTLDNPVCGDRITVDVRLIGDRLHDIAYTVRSCILCEAAASIMGENAAGKRIEDIAEIRAETAAMLENGAILSEKCWSDLEMFRPVADHKNRHHCVLLPLDALCGALEKAASSRGQD